MVISLNILLDGYSINQMNQIKQIHANHLRTSTLNLPQLETLHQKVLQLQNLSYAYSLLLSSKPIATVFLLNKLLQAYSRHGPFRRAILLFSHHLPIPNPHSFTFAFSACSNFTQPFHGQALHARFLRYGFQFDAHVVTSIIDMYSKCGLLNNARLLFDEVPDKDIACWNCLMSAYAKIGEMSSARKLFDEMPVRNVISWTTLVSGYAQNGSHEEAILIFLTMWDSGTVLPNEVTISSVLPACGSIGALGLGERIERYIRKKGYFGNIFVANALIEMYGKCGRIENARRVFDEMGGRRNLCSWNSIIMALALHGKCDEALRLFGDMKGRGFTPDDISFVAVLLACTHGGYVNEGKQIFECMKREHSIAPKLQHYGCMVDLLGRFGYLSEAYDLIRGMPMVPDSVIWGALLGACSFHGEVELAELVADFLFRLEPWNSGNYVILGNIYAKKGKWDDVVKIWKMMRGKQHRKEAGYSVVELEGELCKFLVEDKSHPRHQEIYLVVGEITLVMKDVILDFDMECFEVN